MAGRDIGAALFLIACAVALIWLVIPAETIPGDEGELPQAFMPTLAAAAILVAAAFVFTRAALERARERRAGRAATAAAVAGGAAAEGQAAAPEHQPIDRVFWAVFAGATLLFGLALAVLDRFGFFAGSAVAILAFGLAFHRGAWRAIAVLAVALPAAAYFLVLHVLGLALP